MLKWAFHILFCCCLTAVSQNSTGVSASLKIPMDVQRVEGVDNFGTLYYLKNNAFFKKGANQEYTYSNVQLGRISYANVFNPLKMLLFYKDFNTVMVLDNRLAEILKLDFNTITPYKNASHITTGNDNTVWVFNVDNQRLELYDYKSKVDRAVTVPVSSNVISLTSNYNYCWLLTEKFLYKYNYFGSMIAKIPNDDFSDMCMFNERIYVKKDNKLITIDKDFETSTPIKTDDLLIKQFFVTGETLYIYDSKFLYGLQLKSQ